MSNRQDNSCHYPRLLITVKNQTNERFVKEIKPKSLRYHPTMVYYNRNHLRYDDDQSKNVPSHSSLSTTKRQKNNTNNSYSRQIQMSIPPLMEIKDSYNHSNSNVNHQYSNSKSRTSKRHIQYRNPDVELDWDHGFDLDQLDLYTTNIDIDNYSLMSSTISSSETSLS